MKIATHNGFLHADDVFAIATLKLAGMADEVTRTRDPEKLAAADLRVDVGRQYDPKTGDFDHHQPGGAGERDNGIGYAAFGLIWQQYGEQVCGSGETANYLDARLVQGIDADDIGQAVFTADDHPDLIAPTLSLAISAFNPSWDQNPTEADYDAAFFRAVDSAMPLLKEFIRAAQAQVKGAEIVKKLLREAKNHTLVLDRELPWREVVMEAAPDIWFVVYPRVEGTWSVQTVKKSRQSFDNRRDLPAEWAGKTDELPQVTGVPDATFAHNRRFLAVARSKAGALKLVELAVAAAEV